MNEPQDDPIRALIKDKKNRSKIGQLRELLPSIQDAHAAGVTLGRIVEELSKMGINVSYGYLRTVLHRIRKNTEKKAKKTTQVTKNQAINSTEEKSSDDSSKEEQINLIYQEELTEKQRREKIADLFVSETKISPRLQRILEKKNESSSD